jgi:hypothetical protein
MDLVSSCVMLITSHMASTPSVYKFPVVSIILCRWITLVSANTSMNEQGRTRIETIGVILFCALMTTVAIELLIEAGRTLGTGKSDSGDQLGIVPMICVCVAIGAKFSLMCYCFTYRKHPSVHVFFVSLAVSTQLF